MGDILSVRDLSGFFTCKSGRGTYLSTCDRFSCDFPVGVTVLYGDIDCGGWAVSCTLSDSPFEEVLDGQPVIVYNGKATELEKIRTFSVYIDRTNETFAKNLTVAQQIEINIKRNNLDLSATEVRDIFEIDPERFNRCPNEVGNEIFRCLSAIAYTDMKSVFCFPWLSARMVDYYGKNLIWCCQKLAELNKIVILPTNYAFSQDYGFNIMDVLFENKKSYMNR